MWTKTIKPLTEDQKKRGVVFSSELKREGEAGTLHEVLKSDKDAEEKIKRLKDVRFFKDFAEECGWDVVEEVHL